MVYLKYLVVSFLPSKTGVLPTALRMTQLPLVTRGISLNVLWRRFTSSSSSPCMNLASTLSKAANACNQASESATPVTKHDSQQRLSNTAVVHTSYSAPGAARYNTWLLINLTPTGVVVSFLCLFFSTVTQSHPPPSPSSPLHSPFPTSLLLRVLQHHSWTWLMMQFLILVSQLLPDDVTQAVVNVVIMQQFRFTIGGRADCEHTAGTICKLHETCLEG